MKLRKLRDNEIVRATDLQWTADSEYTGERLMNVVANAKIGAEAWSGRKVFDLRTKVKLGNHIYRLYP